MFLSFILNKSFLKYFEQIFFLQLSWIIFNKSLFRLFKIIFQFLQISLNYLQQIPFSFLLKEHFFQILKIKKFSQKKKFTKKYKNLLKNIFQIKEKNKHRLKSVRKSVNFTSLSPSTKTSVIKRNSINKKVHKEKIQEKKRKEIKKTNKQLEFTKKWRLKVVRSKVRQ